MLAAALGLSLRAADTEVDEESARLVAERDEARRARDFARADALRDELVARGWTVEDTPAAPPSAADVAENPWLNGQLSSGGWIAVGSQVTV